MQNYCESLVMSITITHTRFTSKLYKIVLLVFINALYLYISLNIIQPYLLCLNNVVNVLLALTLLLNSCYRRPLFFALSLASPPV